MTEGYLDIGGATARILMPLYDGEELAETIVLERKVPGRSHNGFHSIDELSAKFIVLADELRGLLDKEDIPPCCVSIKDSEAITEVRDFTVSAEGKTITRSDILFMKRSVNMAIPDGYAPMHRIPIGFRVDDGPLIQDPLGRECQKISFFVMIIAVRNSEIKAYGKVLRNAGIRPKRYIYDGLAHGLAAIRESKINSATIFDLGTNNIGVSVFDEGRPVYFGCADMGMGALTQRLARQLRCTYDTAEKLKKNKGLGARGGAIRYVLSDNKGKDSVDVSQFVNILRMKLSSVFQEAVKVMDANKWPDSDQSFRERIVLTGGGRGMSDIVRVSEMLLKTKIDVARGSQHSEGNNAFMACLGMWLYMGGDDFGELEFLRQNRVVSAGSSGFWQWLKGIFS